MFHLKLKHINNLLTVLLIGLAIYVVIPPFVPGLSLWAKKRTDKTGGYVYQSRINPNPKSGIKPVPSENRLVVPAMLLNQPIYEGRFISVLNNGGTWHRPKTSSPDQEGNTVIIAHRYTYKGLSTFYNLDKLRLGDPIIVYWSGKEYDYKVTETKVVAPSTGEIEKQTNKTQLTLYTCTPLWTAKNRLVVIAEPIEANP